jgi:hypothetical protein
MTVDTAHKECAGLGVIRPPCPERTHRTNATNCYALFCPANKTRYSKVNINVTTVLKEGLHTTDFRAGMGDMCRIPSFPPPETYWIQISESYRHSLIGDQFVLQRLPGVSKHVSLASADLFIQPPPTTTANRIMSILKTLSLLRLYRLPISNKVQIHFPSAMH